MAWKRSSVRSRPGPPNSLSDSPYDRRTHRQPVKPAREVHVGDLLRVKTEGGEFEIKVLALSDVRGPASVAQTLYTETDASREARLKAAEERRALKAFTPAPPSRPSKRDRRRT